jgi:hypothetical protein
MLEARNSGKERQKRCFEALRARTFNPDKLSRAILAAKEV